MVDSSSKRELFVFCEKELSSDVYDLYADDDNDEEDGRFPASPTRLVLSPTKHFTLNINVGGTVT